MSSPQSNEVEIRVTAKDSTDDTLHRVERKWKESGERIGSSMAGGLTGVLTNIGNMFGRLATSMLSPQMLMMLAAAIAVAAAGFTAMAGTVLLAAGAFGTLAAAGFGLTATFATLMLGFSGIGDALKAHGQQSAGAGRSSAAAAREVKSATDALADAQRAAVRASDDVSRARIEETRHLQDLSRALGDMELDEERAELSVRRAKERLRESRRGGSALDRTDAALGLREAERSLQNVRDRVEDLKREKAEADAKGVEGSDRVQAALERQMLAQRHLEDATRRLADAQRGPAAGGANKFAEAMAALSANGQALVLTLLALKPQFDDLQRSVQDRLLAGLDTTIKDLATKWIPALKTGLGELADSFNTTFKDIASAITEPKFMADVGEILGKVGENSEKLGKGLSSFLGALSTLGRASIPFWDKLGTLVGGMLEHFGEWIAKKDESGDLGKFFDTAASALDKAWQVGGKFFGVLGQIVGILFDDSKAAGKSFLETVSEGLDDISVWLDNPENQEKLKEWADRLITVVGAVFTVIGALISLGVWIDEHRLKLSSLGDAFSGLGKRISLGSAGMFDGIKESFKGALNWIIDRWNGLSFRLPSANFLGAQIGGGSLDTPNIPRFASGGIGGGLARVAERGQELIRTPDGGMLLAMPHGSSVIPNGTTESMLGRGGGGGETRLVVELNGTDEDEVRKIRRLAKVFGAGNVQLAFGNGRVA